MALIRRVMKIDLMYIYIKKLNISFLEKHRTTLKGHKRQPDRQQSVKLGVDRVDMFSETK